MVNSISMRIVVISHKVSSRAVKLVKMFCFKLFEVNLNAVLETIVFFVCGCILIEPIYDILFEDVMVSRLNVHTIGKENFYINGLGFVQERAQDA